MYGEHTAGAAEALIVAAKVDGLDTELTKCRSAHDAGLDSDVEFCVV